MFKTVDGKFYFTAQWFYRAEDTVRRETCRVLWIIFSIVLCLESNSYFFFLLFFQQAIQQCSDLIDDKRIFFSEIKDVNPLNCLVKVLRINRIPPNVSSLILICMNILDFLYFFSFTLK